MNLPCGSNFLGAIPADLVPDEDLFLVLPLISTFEAASRKTAELGVLNDSEVNDDFLSRQSLNPVAVHANFLQFSPNLLLPYPSDTLQDIIDGLSSHGSTPELPKSTQPKRKPKPKPKPQTGRMRLGPNRFGRKGTIRCERCRSWRRKVNPQNYVPYRSASMTHLILISLASSAK